MLEPPPVITKEAFMESHRWDEQRLKRYLNRRRKGSVTLYEAARLELRREAAKFLCANNATARIRFAKATQRERRRFLRGDSFAWFTLIPKKFVVSEDDAPTFQPSRLQAWGREVLRGVSFFATVDAAFYTNIRIIVGKWKRGVSWHVHGFAWNLTSKEMRKLRKRINGRFDALLPGVNVCEFLMVDEETLEEKIWYMLKAPQKAYRVYPVKGEVIDPETGEIDIRSIGVFKQKKGTLRPGDLVRAYSFMAGRQLDKLAFAGAEGKELLRKVNERALRPYDKALEKHRKAGRAAYLRMGYRPEPGAPLT